MLIFAIRKLQQYLQHYSVRLTLKADPLKYTLIQTNSNGRLAKIWVVLFQQYDIEYISKKAIKGEALANFLAAHLILNDLLLATDLPAEEVITIKAWEELEIYPDKASKSPIGEKQEDTQIAK